jgi:hypothetical protein
MAAVTVDDIDDDGGDGTFADDENKDPVSATTYAIDDDDGDTGDGGTTTWSTVFFHGDTIL